MPELPEVETIRRDLNQQIPGAEVAGVLVHHRDLLLSGWTPGRFGAAITGSVFGALVRRGKFLGFPLGKGDARRVMRVQLRMTGRFAIGADSPPPEAGFRHPGIDFALADGRTLYYDDVRRLGGIDLLLPSEWRQMSRNLGPEPLARSFTGKRLYTILAPLKAPIKNVLLDQRRVAGIGNIYASEALFRAGIDPRRPAGELTLDEARGLHRWVRRILRGALEARGTRLRDYQAVNGRSGRYRDKLRVYGRYGEPCPRCRRSIDRLNQAGRSTFFCPACQR